MRIQMKFGNHVPVREKSRATQSPMAAFSRGLQVPGMQWEFKFTNGYGASVINDGYGAESGLYELAVLGPDGHLTYGTPITDDVLGHLDKADVTAALDAIEALTERSILEGRIAREAEKLAQEIKDSEERIATLRTKLEALQVGNAS